MAISIIQCPEYRKFADRAMQRCAALHWLLNSDLKIGFLMSTQKKTDENGAVKVRAECSKCTPKDKALGDYDYLITYYEPNIQGLTEYGMEALTAHELGHIGEDGKSVKGHDIVIGEFRFVLTEYGEDWDRR